MGVWRSMALYTKNITLAETTDAEFRRRKEFWRRDQLLVKPSTLLATIENPLYAPLVSENPVDDYVSLFKKLFHHDSSPLLCVRTPQGWGKYLRKQLEEPDLVTLAKCAAAQPDKINYLEVKFYYRSIAPMVRAPFPFHQPVIEFTESLLNGQKAIIGYQVHFPLEYQHLFTLNFSGIRPNSDSVHGLWVP